MQSHDSQQSSATGGIKCATSVCLSVCLSVAGFLQSADGAVLKPILGRVKGQREVDFYRRLFSEDCDDRALLDLREFVARFLGLWTTLEHPGCE